jgi:nucleotide-binding universal stress UspA family protein
MSVGRWIVVGTDFSDGARDAFRCALGLAGDMGAQVALVHAYEDTDADTDEDPSSRLATILAREIARSRTRGPEVHVEQLVRRGRPWDKILNVATEYGAELIVVGSSGQTGEARGLFLGRVVNRVLALSTRTVVVVRADAVSKSA